MIEYLDDNGTECSIYVLQTDTGTLFTTLIKRLTNAPYNHASLALDAELNELFSFGRKHATNPWAAGFVAEDVFEAQSFQKEKLAYRYNLIGLLGVLMNLDLESKNAYFCSQFVAETLRNIGINLWERPSTLVTPNDFLRHPAFEKLYEGFLYDYPLLDKEKLRYMRIPTDPSIQLGGQAV